MRGAEIRILILDILAEAAPYAVPEETLLRHIEARLGQPVARVDADEHILWLQQRNLIRALPGKLGATLPRWEITPAGHTERTR